MQPVESFPIVKPGLMDEAALCAFASRMAGALQAPLVIYLEGDLGAGKTTFCRALIQSLGHEGRVKSPTYGLLERYDLRSGSVLHLDLYRIGDPGELEYLAITDLFEDHTILLVEWPERGQGALPAPDLTIALGHEDDQRFVILRAHSKRGYAVCRASTDLASN